MINASKKNNILLFLISVGLFISLLLSGTIGVTTSILLQSLPLAILGVVCILAAFIDRGSYKSLNLFHVVSLVGIIMYFGIRAYVSDSIDLGIGDLYLLFSASSVYCVVKLVGGQKVFKMGMLAIFLLFVFNVANYFESFALLRDETIGFALGTPKSGMFNHRNFCSIFLMQVTLMLVVYTLNGTRGAGSGGFKSILFRISTGVLAVTGFLSLYYCGARGGMLGLFFGLLVATGFYILPKKRRSVNVLWSIIIWGVFFCGIYFNKLALFKKSGGLEDRLDYFGMAIDQIPDALIFGSGSMSYSYKSYENWSIFGDHHLDHVWVHNEFLQIVTDYGIVGLLLVLILVLQIVVFGLQQIIECNQKGMMPCSKAIAGICVLVGFLISCLVSFPAHSFINLMIVAFAAGYLVKKKSLNVMSKRTTLLYRVIFISMGVVMVALSIPQIKAAKVYASHSIYTDSMNWNPYKHTDDKWYLALEEVNDISPNYISYSRLADLDVIRAESGVDRVSNAQKALQNSELALKRHPHFAPAMLVKSKALWYIGDYEKADESFEDLASFTKYRRRFYKVNTTWAACLLDAGRFHYSKGSISFAKKYYEKSLRVWLPLNYDKNRALSILDQIILEYANVLIIDKDYKTLDDLIVSRYGVAGNYLYKQREPICLNQARLFFLYAQNLYFRRKPSLAHKYFNWANHNYVYSQKKWQTKLSSEDKVIWGESKRIMRILKTANIQPAK